jgi:hypothetical protein
VAARSVTLSGHIQYQDEVGYLYCIHPFRCDNSHTSCTFPALETMYRGRFVQHILNLQSLITAESSCGEGFQFPKYFPEQVESNFFDTFKSKVEKFYDTSRKLITTTVELVRAGRGQTITINSPTFGNITIGINSTAFGNLTLGSNGTYAPQGLNFTLSNLGNNHTVLTLNTTLLNNGTMLSNNGTLLNNNGTLFLNGTLLNNNGTMLFGNATVLSNGTLLGNGTLLSNGTLLFTLLNETVAVNAVSTALKPERVRKVEKEGHRWRHIHVKPGTIRRIFPRRAHVA